MIKRHVVTGFLTFSGVWNPRLMFVLGSAVVLNFFSFRYVLNQPHPIFDSQFHLPSSTVVDLKLIIGASIFGVGWGLGGICPGPALIAFYCYLPQTLVFFISLLFGIFVEAKFDGQLKDALGKYTFLDGDLIKNEVK